MMLADGKVGVAVVGEDEVHAALAMRLFDSAVSALAHKRGADWLLEVGEHRAWLVFDAHDPRGRGFFDSHRPLPLVSPTGRPVRSHGFIDQRPAGPAAHRLLQLYLHHRVQNNPPDVVLILFDTDGEPGIAESAAQVYAEVRRREGGPLLVIGTPHRDAEAWLFAAPLPDDAGTRARHALARQVLSFDPAAQPERLSAAPNHAVTDAKRVLRYVILGEGDKLAAGQPESAAPPPDEANRLAAALAADLDRARRFADCGLAAFLDALLPAVEAAFSAHLPPATHP